MDKEKTMSEEQAVVKVESEFALTTEQFSQQLQIETERRALMEQYIRNNLVESVDYGVIPGTKRPTLLKPGAERVCNLLKLRMTFRVDSDTWKMLSKQKKEIGTFCYICELIAPNGEITAHGQGLASCDEKMNSIYQDGKVVGKKPWPTNTCMKIAKKRAMVDAALANGFCGLSDRFTQDMEDVPAESENVPKESKQTTKKGGGGGSTEKQQKAVWAIAKANDIDVRALLKTIGCESTKDMTFEQASTLIEGLKGGKYDDMKPKTDDVIDAEYDDIDLDDDPF